MPILKFYFTVLIIFCVYSCKKADAHPPTGNSFYPEVITSKDRKTITPEEAKTYHVDSENKYEYRTGEYGHYEYNYDVKRC
jgi:hypothetical protein